MSHIKEFQHLKISLKDLKSATNDFGSRNCIGRGGFGKVYQGELLLSKGLTMVAVKRLDKAFGQGAPEFWKEIMLLSQYKHENLVSLVGFCDECDEYILVYEYLSNKSLDLYLSSPKLSWNQRLRICIDAACGLQYLHDSKGTQQRVLHRDIKSANILLDGNWSAKISDFGLSKIGPANQQFTFLVSNAVGTFGYCDPLYMETGVLTKESDVYSFGVVLFEVLCGRHCLENYEDIRKFLAKLVQKCYDEKKLDTIIDTSVKKEISPGCMERFSTIAYQCLMRDHTKRPLMAEIVKELKTALQYQVEYEIEKEKNSASESGGVPRKADLIERSLPCTLEELYKGTTKKMKIQRDHIADSSGKKEEEILIINIMPGWKKGTKITFEERGDKQPNMIPADIVFVIEEKPHPTFTRDGNDLVVTRHITLAEALTGYTVHVTTIGGRNLIIPINNVIHPDYEEVVHTEGMPISKDPTKKGDLRIKFNVKFPTRLTPAQKRKIKESLND